MAVTYSIFHSHWSWASIWKENATHCSIFKAYKKYFCSIISEKSYLPQFSFCIPKVLCLRRTFPTVLTAQRKTFVLIKRTVRHPFWGKKWKNFTLAKITHEAQHSKESSLFELFQLIIAHSQLNYCIPFHFLFKPQRYSFVFLIRAVFPTFAIS